jgi:hypothetical protein
MTGLVDISNINVAFLAAPVDNCNAIVYTGGAFIIITIPSTSALFFFRMKAIYNHNIITIFFGSMLFALFRLCFLFPHSGEERAHRANSLLHRHTICTLRFNAESSALHIRHSCVHCHLALHCGRYVGGTDEVILSRSVLQGGQLYYLFVAVSSHR